MDTVAWDVSNLIGAASVAQLDGSNLHLNV